METEFLKGRITVMPSKNLVQGEKGLLCPKSSHLNPGNLKQCEYCNSQLFVKCKKCGPSAAGDLQVPRVSHRIHKSPFRNSNAGCSAGRRRSRLPNGILLIVAYGAFKVITIVRGNYSLSCDGFHNAIHWSH
ncbi:MAG: hypothetical protein CM1200mP29_05360 [Verrucomicrobiota bacterium]|nr:MAG: hypothetical protein CM1200mP29_05360 [Verrucomicrobiota bacterium]